ncbi:MAG: hypothetical protein GY759_19390 [Chloroflexi bacterium]|nr:hypothetical protein [Chloroflexota bacterium]
MTPDDLSYEALLEYLVSSLMRKSYRGIALTEIEGLQLRNAARDLAQISDSDRAVLFNSTQEAQSTAGVQDQLAYYRDNAGSLTSAEGQDFLILLAAVALEGSWGTVKV